MAKLFTPFKIRNLEFKNRIFVSPMCQYSSLDGVANQWHMVHLGSRAVGGAALVMAEATSVSPEGRISYGDAGIWNDKQVEALKPITEFIRAQGAVAAIQLAHAGRKASTDVPWGLSTGPISKNHKNGWQTLAPSPIPFDKNYEPPVEMKDSDIEKVISDFETAAKRSLQAGYQVIEAHMAHGYLMHQFLSPLSNVRKDKYGGSLENRMRLPLIVAEKLRQIWPEELPVFVRISATDWVQDGWDIKQSIQFCLELEKRGIDFIDCSSGGSSPHAQIKSGPSYQVPFAIDLKSKLKIPVGAVGIITEAEQAEQILKENQADVVLLARELLRDPYWPLHAAKKLGHDLSWPKQYERAKR